MKNTRFTEPTNMEVVLNSHQCDYIRFDGAVKTGEQWLKHFRKYDEEMLDCEVTLEADGADYYDFEMLLHIDYFGKGR